MSVSIQDPRATPRYIADQLRRFVLVDDAPQPASRNAISLSDAGFALLSLKDQILIDNSRFVNGNFGKTWTIGVLVCEMADR
ncbi:hypothetical protein KIN20_005840 [Parelaphostrongylus tenuis]|uniref:Uncharacterized protein n=1 Tax=Parelaphostrongylus tenuis TaxID=148309 RepID=A0AAD5MJH9_PARTN|nr:hypothetical protein KIN20_005840 [Parelaphostrongylus tenuis]